MPLYELDGVSPKLPGEGKYWIAPDAHVIGDVVLCEDVGIWFGAVLRGDRATITIGARSNIQDGTVVHADADAPMTVGEDCTVGHNAIIHGCTIGIVGANALVTEGKEFPPNSLIMGNPAKAVREVDPELRARLVKGAAGYVENWKRYAKGLKRID